jgi:DNA (cytosine-5)-methyltransferase 1
MKILNLYCGIGGNRKLWGDEHEITAVENVPEIAKIYQDFFPKDKVIIADAHQYLLEHFKEFDFIWSSPPCPSHSKARYIVASSNNPQKNQDPIYPNMKLYEEILLLQGYFKGKYVVENVISWYKPLITPHEIAMHYFWTNFYINPVKIETRGHYENQSFLQKLKGFDLTKYKGIDKGLLLRNCVEPETGLHIFQEAFREYKTLL